MSVSTLYTNHTPPSGAPSNDHVRRPSFPNSYLEKVCPRPQPLRSLEDWERLHHDDLPHLDDDALAREGRCARLRADLDRDAMRRAWFVGRVAAVGIERTHRRSGTVITTSVNDSSRSRSLRGTGGKEQSRRTAGVQVIGGRVVGE